MPRSGVTGSPMLYTNTGSNNWGANKVSLTGTTFNMTGAVALDYDWDGSMDLVLYRALAQMLMSWQETTRDARCW